MTLTGRRERLAGLAAMLAGVAAFAFMDAGLKVMSEHYSPLQGAALRGLSAWPIVFVWALLAGGCSSLLKLGPG